MLSDLAHKEPEKYQTFWETFGRVLKEGLAEDQANRESIAKLLRFASTTNESEKQTVSLDEYIERMKEGQEKIYFITADSYPAAKDSPLLEIFKKKGIEVLLLSDPLDEYFIGVHLTEYKEKELQSVARGEVDLSKMEDQAEKAEQEKNAEGAHDLIERLKKTLGEQVKDVRVTTRLTNSPACLVVDENDLDPNLQRMLKAMGQAAPAVKRILEINPTHPLILKLKQQTDEQRFIDWAYVLYDQSILSLGEQLENPTQFVNRLNDLLAH